MLLDEFVSLVGREFVADCTPRTVAVTLIEAVPLRFPSVTDRPPFSLLFRSAPNALLMSGSYALRCEGFGPDLVHLSPISPPPQSEPGYYYQAIFN